MMPGAASLRAHRDAPRPELRSDAGLLMETARDLALTARQSMLARRYRMVADRLEVAIQNSSTEDALDEIVQAAPFIYHPTGDRQSLLEMLSMAEWTPEQRRKLARVLLQAFVSRMAD